MEKIYGMHKLVGLQLFWRRTPTFSSGTPTFGQMGVLNSCFQNPSESSASVDWEPAINLEVDMPLYSHKSRIQSINLQFIINVKFNIITLLNYYLFFTTIC